MWPVAGDISSSLIQAGLKLMDYSSTVQELHAIGVSEASPTLKALPLALSVRC